jgi:radical SAM superfamily enzyme YgiQ (UPF0313 family)
MLGYPGETLETIEQTKKFVRENPLTIMHLTKFTPYPGSPIYRDIYGTNIRDDHWEKMNGMNFVWESDNLTIDELDKNYVSILKSFYVRPKMQWYYTKFTFKHPTHLFRLLKFLSIMLSVKLKGRFGKMEPKAQVQHEL